MRTDFNEAFSKIDTAIAGAGAKIATGIYVGNDESPRTIPLDFTPSAVLIIPGNKFTANESGTIVYGGIALADAPLYIPIDRTDNPCITIVPNGFQVYYAAVSQWNGSFTAYTNGLDIPYRYIAIGA